MSKPPKIVIPGLNRGAGIPGGYVLGRRRGSKQGPAELLNLTQVRAIGIATTTDVTSSTSLVQSVAHSETVSLSRGVSTSLSSAISGTSSLSSAVSTVISGSISTVTSMVNSLSTAGGGGGGGGAAWSVVASWTWSTNVTTVTLAGLGGYSDLTIIVKDMTLSTPGFRFIQASIDSGVSVFSTSGDYKTFAATGLPASAGDFCGHSTSTASAVSLRALVAGNIANATKVYSNNQVNGYFANASLVTNAINAIVLGVTAGNITGGSITILGR